MTGLGGIAAALTGLQSVILFSLTLALVTLTSSQALLKEDRKGVGIH